MNSEVSQIYLHVFAGKVRSWDREAERLPPRKRAEYQKARNAFLCLHQTLKNCNVKDADRFISSVDEGYQELELFWRTVRGTWTPIS